MLTDIERKWLNKLQKVLNECPSDRLGFYTIGDPMVTVYDRTKEAAIINRQDKSCDDFGAAVTHCGADLNAYLTFPAQVASAAG